MAIAFTVAVLALLACNPAAASRPQIVSEDGHILAKSGGVVTNLTESISVANVDALVKGVQDDVTRTAAAADAAIKGVERRAEGDLTNLVQELSKTVAGLGDKLVGAIQSLEDQQNKSASESCANAQKSITIKLQGDGTPTKATGLPWNPIKVPETPVPDSGGHAVRILFPTPRLYSNPAVKIYSCKFTLLDSKGTPTKTVRVSANVAADTEGTFACTTPAWSPAGSGLPPMAKWKTVLSVYENGREMPAPKSEAVFTWQPSTPKMTIATAFEAKAKKAEATKFTVPFNIDYPYGAKGYADVSVTAKASSNVLSSVSVGAANTGAAPRTLSFTLTDKTGKKTNAYTIVLTAKSAKTGLTSTAKITINFVEKADVMAEGATPELLKEGPMAELFKRVNKGSAKTWKLCYSRHKHGFSNVQFNNRCRSKGNLFFVQRRGSGSNKGRIWGGYAAHNWRRGHSGYSSENYGKNFLFRIQPDGKGDTVNFATTYRRPQYSSYPGDTNYLMCFGGGHDLCTAGNSGNQWSGFGYSWRAEKSHSTSGTWFQGSGSYNAKNENDLYEVYIVQ